MAQNQGDLSSDLISIQALNSLTFSGTSPNAEVISGIRSEALENQKASDINISANQLLMKDNARILTITFGDASSGDINVNVVNQVQLDNAAIVAANLSEGNAGDIHLSTSQLQVMNGSAVNSASAGNGNGGNIFIRSELVEVSSGLASSTGRTNIAASTFNNGNAGNLEINTQQLLVRNGAAVSSSSASDGNAGNVIINASKLVEVDGEDLTFNRSNTTGSTIRSSVQAAITSEEGLDLPDLPAANGGNLTINTPIFKISNNGVISVQNQGTGSAGTLLDD